MNYLGKVDDPLTIAYGDLSLVRDARCAKDKAWNKGYAVVGKGHLIRLPNVIGNEIRRLIEFEDKWTNLPGDALPWDPDWKEKYGVEPPKPLVTTRADLEAEDDRPDWVEPKIDYSKDKWQNSKHPEQWKSDRVKP